ncbi:GNAT family N-acetyltransferase [Roseibium sp. SCP14]|uniref:GNAT family N-acetyltransferase n=1 Tax=Roseibium sp. SCP14 TaxID=3141375 RepID=UPI003336780E
MRTDPGHNHHLRVAQAEDMPACATILNDWIDETPWMPRVHPHEDVIRHHRGFVFENRTVLVSENSTRNITGFLACSDDQFITGFYLSPQARGMGVGAAMLKHSKARNPKGLKLWTFVANSGAQKFYLREGFREIRRTDGDNEEGLPDILYSWKPEGVAS